MTAPDTPRFVRDWLETIQPTPLAEVAPDPDAAAIFSADMINGFLHFGALASPRVQALADDVASSSHARLEPRDPERRAAPGHPPPGHARVRIVSAACPRRICRVADHPGAGLPAVRRCIHDHRKELAQPRHRHRLRRLARHAPRGDDRHRRRQLHGSLHVPTGDAPQDARQLPQPPGLRRDRAGQRGRHLRHPDQSRTMPAGGAHPADFFHEVFLYHMAQNGIRIVSAIT